MNTRTAELYSEQGNADTTELVFNRKAGNVKTGNDSVKWFAVAKRKNTSHRTVLSADGDRVLENFSICTAAENMTGWTTHHNYVTELVSFDFIRQHREEHGLYDDGWVRCIDWDGAPLEVE